MLQKTKLKLNTIPVRNQSEYVKGNDIMAGGWLLAIRKLKLYSGTGSSVAVLI